MSTTNHTPGNVIWTPEQLRPKLIIPHDIALQWMQYGSIGYADHNSEWGCAVKLDRDGEYGPITVVGWEPYKVSANGGYWESIDGERDAHMNRLIEAGLEDDIPKWNGLFHTHPVGSSASMSGTDQKQLEEMSSPGWWAVSIICPANKDGMVIPAHFMHHYSDARYFGGNPITIGNLKPDVGTVVNTDLEAVREHMKDLMIKRTYAVNKYEHKRWEGTTGYRPYPIGGDWVWLKEIDTTSYEMDALTDEEKAEFCSLQGGVYKVESTVTGPAGRHIKVAGGWLLEPKTHETSLFGDDIIIVAQRGTPEAKTIEAKIKAGGSPTELSTVKKVIGSV